MTRGKIWVIKTTGYCSMNEINTILFREKYAVLHVVCFDWHNPIFGSAVSIPFVAELNGLQQIKIFKRIRLYVMNFYLLVVFYEIKWVIAI